MCDFPCRIKRSERRNKKVKMTAGVQPMEDVAMVSVIVPVYNKEKYVARTIESIIRQTYEELEILLVDDGSTDQSGKICREYQLKDNRIKYIYQENGGPSKARNHGLQIARGAYIAFIDADDTFETYAIEKMLTMAQDTKAELVVAPQKCISADGTEKINNCLLGLANGIISREVFLKSLAVDNINVFWGSQGNKLYDAAVINNCNLRFDEKYKHAEDFLFNIAYYCQCKEIAFINMVTYDIYDVPQSLSKTLDMEDVLERGKRIWSGLDDFYKRIDRMEYKPYYDAFIYKVFADAIISIEVENGKRKYGKIKKQIEYCMAHEWVLECVLDARAADRKHKLILFLLRNKAYCLTAILYTMKDGIKEAFCRDV
jgi:glycosyltransferase EpsJ